LKIVEVAQQFIDETIIALRETETSHNEADEFIQTLVAELESANLKHSNHPTDDSASPPMWKDVVQLTREQRTDSLLSSILGIQPYFSWFRGNRFWPEEANKNFAEKMWGVFLVGEHGASFQAEDRYVAILTIIEADTTYPLHQHRIEEVYYVVSGHAEWSHDGVNWVTLAPGSTFFNKSYEPHSIRTNEQTLFFISFYLPPISWEGHLVSETEREI